MNETVLKDYGWCQIIKRMDQYFLRYDEGGIAIIMKEVVVTKEQAEKAMIDQYKAEEILVEVLKSRN